MQVVQDDVKLVFKIDKTDWNTFVYYLEEFLKNWGWKIKSITAYESKKGKTVKIWINFVGWEKMKEE
jgi:translation initiation factor IF-3